MNSVLHLASEATRELPAPPYVFGIGAFAILGVLLYLVMRMD